MRNKWSTIFNISVLTVISLILIFIVWNFSFKTTAPAKIKCVDVNNGASFVYNACYDAYSKNILLNIKRGEDSYTVKSLKVSFFDFSKKSYNLDKVPAIGKSDSYKIPASKNPKHVDVTLSVVDKLSSSICKTPKTFFVRYCSSTRKNGVDVSITPLGGTDFKKFISIKDSSMDDSDILSSGLVDKERVWASKCGSDWSCENWGACSNGIQRRDCNDSKNCFVPTNVPKTVKYCNGTCIEDWSCEWSKCDSGFTVPKCRDLNSCRTFYNIPHKLACRTETKCTPNIECGKWSKCNVNYNFDDLTKGVARDLSGIQSRYCSDKNSCVSPKEETEKCSMSIDIYAKRVTRCGENFIGIYNSLNDKLIAKIKSGSLSNPYLNINLDRQESSQYCDYCFDGVMDGDETGIDCGGGCESCTDKYSVVTIKKQSWLQKIINTIMFRQ